MSMSSARRSAADCSTARARPAARSSARPACICGWRTTPPTMCSSMRSAPATRWLPGARHAGADAVEHGVDAQYRLAARLAARHARIARASRARREDLLAGLDEGSPRRSRARCSTTPISRKRASAGRSSMPPRGPVHRPSRPAGLCRPHARRVRRPGLRGARLLRGDGTAARRDPAHRRRGALQGAAPHPRQRARRAGAQPASARKRARPARR